MVQKRARNLANRDTIGLAIVAIVLGLAWSYWHREPDDFGKLPFATRSEVATTESAAGGQPRNLCWDQAAAGYWHTDPDLCNEWWDEWYQSSRDADTVRPP
jgi:hypothetical protein